MEGIQGTGGPLEIDRCPRILSLDGGGVRGLSSLLILRNIMEEIARRKGPGTAEAHPYEYFDLIGGTGTGGWIAIMLGRLRMSIAECVDEFIELSKTVFEVDQVQNGVIPMGDNQCRFDYQKLETAIKTLVEKKLLDANAIMADSSDRPKNVPTFVVATKGLHADGPPTLFRSYQCTGYSADRCTIWEAVCATSAAPTFFKPIKIDIPPPGGTFVDGGLTHNNPAELALSEAQRIWDTVKRFCLVSLGTGRLKSVRVVDVRSNAVPGGEASRTVRSSSLRPSKRIRLQETSSEGLSALTKIGEMCVQLATSSEHTHQRLLRLSQSGDPDKRFPYHRFNVERDMHEIELQEWSQMEAIGAHTATYMEEGERESKRNHCIEDLTNPAPIQFIIPVSPLSPKHFLMPYERNPHFTGRNEHLTLLSEKLRDTTAKKYNHRVAIYGMGGVGKTQLAIEYVYRNKAKYHSIFWISSADQATLLSGFQDIARVTECILNLDRANLKPAGMAKAVLSWLGNQHGWLLVMDNMDDIDVALGYLPEMAKGGHTLITTRNPDHLTIPAEGLHIPTLDEDTAVDLLLLRSQIEGTESSLDSNHAVEIVRELGCLALAIEQAAAFIRSSVDGIAKFLAVYHKFRHQFLRQKLPRTHPYPNSVAATFLLSFNRLHDDADHGEHAIILLRLLAFLNPDGVLIDFLRSGSHGLDDALRQVVDDELVFHHALELLQRYSLVALSQKRDNIVIHRLVQAVIKDHLDETELRTFRVNVIGVCNIFPEIDITLMMTDRIKCRKLQSQVLEPVVEAAEAYSDTASDLLLKIGRFLSADAKYRDSERVFSICVEMRAKLFSEDHPKTLNAMSWLADTFCESGKLNQAAAMHDRVLEIRKRILGEEHLDTLSSMHHIALVFHYQGKLDQAAAMYPRVLEGRKRILGEEHPDTLISIYNLAGILHDLGKLDQAAAMDQRVLEGRKRILGEEHPDTLRAMGRVAWSLGQQGKLSEATALGEKALLTMRRILGEEHPTTVVAMGDLALTFGRQGKLDQEAVMEENVLEARKRTLGEEHPYTLTAIENLSLSYYSLGRRLEARELLRKAVAVSRKVLGEDHPYTRERVARLSEWLGTFLLRLV